MTPAASLTQRRHILHYVSILKDVKDRFTHGRDNTSSALAQFNQEDDRVRACAWAEAALRVFQQIGDAFAVKVEEQLAMWRSERM